MIFDRSAVVGLRTGDGAEFFFPTLLWGTQRESPRAAPLAAPEAESRHLLLGDVGAPLRGVEFAADVTDAMARVLLRRNAGDALALAIEQRLFGTCVPWDKVDLELSAIGNVETRIVRLKEYLARAPNDPAGGMRLVRLLARAGHADEALLFSRKLKAAGLLTPRLVLALGDLQADAGQTDDAIRTYSEIVEFDPRNQAARQLLGDVYLAHGWYDLAYAQYQTLADLAPDNLIAQLRLALAAVGAGRTDEALRLERKVARLSTSCTAVAPARPTVKTGRAAICNIWSGATAAPTGAFTLTGQWSR